MTLLLSAPDSVILPAETAVRLLRRPENVKTPSAGRRQRAGWRPLAAHQTGVPAGGGGERQEDRKNQCRKPAAVIAPRVDRQPAGKRGNADHDFATGVVLPPGRRRPRRIRRGAPCIAQQTSRTRPTPARIAETSSGPAQHGERERP